MKWCSITCGSKHLCDLVHNLGESVEPRAGDAGSLRYTLAMKMVLTLTILALVSACHSNSSTGNLAASGKTCAELHDEIRAAEQEIRRLKFKQDNAFSLGGYLQAPFEGAKAGGLLGSVVGIVLYPVVSGSYTEEDERLMEQNLTAFESQVNVAKHQGCKKPGSGNQGLGNAILILGAR